MIYSTDTYTDLQRNTHIGIAEDVNLYKHLSKNFRSYV
jgi:hypothetical protein